MFCSNCGNKIDESAFFCPVCWTVISKSDTNANRIDSPNGAENKPQDTLGFASEKRSGQTSEKFNQLLDGIEKIFATNDSTFRIVSGAAAIRKKFQAAILSYASFKHGYFSETAFWQFFQTLTPPPDCEEYPIFMHDRTVFGSGKTGFLVTNKNFYSSDFPRTPIALSEIESITPSGTTDILINDELKAVLIGASAIETYAEQLLSAIFLIVQFYGDGLYMNTIEYKGRVLEIDTASKTTIDETPFIGFLLNEDEEPVAGISGFWIFCYLALERNPSEVVLVAENYVKYSGKTYWILYPAHTTDTEDYIIAYEHQDTSDEIWHPNTVKDDALKKQIFDAYAAHRNSGAREASEKEIAYRTKISGIEYIVADYENEEEYLVLEAFVYKGLENLYTLVENRIMKDKILNMWDSNDSSADADETFSKMKAEILPVDESFDLEESLAETVGLYEIKEYIRGLEAQLIIQQKRKSLGLAVAGQAMHMIFKGNPGTGKTTIARTIAKLLYHLGILNQPKLLEVDRSGLVGGYVGQTAIKTKSVIEEALDGVLFIDEAYSLKQGNDDSFGTEATDTLVKFMEDYRDRLVVVLAGYSGKMDKFLASNVGLKSRFPNIIEFPDYTIEELLTIADGICKKNDYYISKAAREALADTLSVLKSDPYFGNGRDVRNLLERAFQNSSRRLLFSEKTDFTKEELTTITAEDISC